VSLDYPAPIESAQLLKIQLYPTFRAYEIIGADDPGCGQLHEIPCASACVVFMGANSCPEILGLLIVRSMGAHCPQPGSSAPIISYARKVGYS